MDDIEERIRSQVRNRVRPEVRPAPEPHRAVDEVDLDRARQRTINGTILLFDKERVLRNSPDGPEKPNQYSKRQWVEKFKLAFVDSKIRMEAEADVPDPWFTYRDPQFRGILVPCSPEVSAAMRAHVVEKLSEALREKADAVVFPEFALPPVDLSDLFPDIRSFDPFNPDHQALVDARFEEAAASMRDDARNLAGCGDTAMPFIFYGSMHCHRSRYNVGVVSPGHPFETGYVLAAERGNPITTRTKVVPEEISRTGPLVHKKRFPARRVGEAARVPGGLGFRLYPSKIGCIAVMICSDAIDLNQFWYIVRHNQQADVISSPDRIGLVIVPSYTHSDMLHITCRDLSTLAHTTVFVGNATGKVKTDNDLYTQAMPPSMIFQCGKDKGEMSAAGILPESRMKKGVRYYNFQPAPQMRPRDPDKS